MIRETIGTIRDEIASFTEHYQETLDRCDEQLSEMSSAVDILSQSASGSWMGYQSSLYFTDFRRPPPAYEFDDHRIVLTGQLPQYWQQKTIDDIIAYVAERVDGLTLDPIISEIQRAFDEAKRIERIIETDLLPLQIEEPYAREFEGLRRFLEEHPWMESCEDIVRARMPTGGMIHDTRAAQQGIRVPPHVHYEAGILQQQLKIQSIRQFIEYMEKFIRKIEVISGQSLTSGDETAVVVISQLCNRFHQIARQLLRRHDGRGTLVINDEYDVQDLLSSLLLIHFDDIREEEWTPSSAGRSSRMDILLKRERIVIETKKSRDGLDARRLGDELLLDIGHYAAHPDCRTLICFVYDPEGRIKNPRGLEDDLARHSTGTLRVIPMIRP